jgi:hypothetical protein
MTSETGERWSARVVLLAGLLVAATVLGGWRVSGSSPDDEAAPTMHLGGAAVSVTHVERVAGLSAEDLGGMTHGIQGLVPEDQTMLRVSLVLTAGSSTAVYDPSDLWIESSRTSQDIRPVGGALGRGSLSAGASISGAVSFVVPRSGDTYVLHAAGTDATVSLGTVDAAPPGPEHEGDGTTTHDDQHHH